MKSTVLKTQKMAMILKNNSNFCIMHCRCVHCNIHKNNTAVKDDMRHYSIYCLEERSKKVLTCILALLHWEMACSAVPAPSEMKLSGKLQS